MSSAFDLEAEPGTPARPGFGTRAIHAGQTPDPTTGALMPPIYANSTYAQSSPGVHQGLDYGRSHNPTRFAFERCIADLESGAQAFAFASGLASQQYGNFYNRLYNLAAIGQNAAAQQGSASQNAANNIGGLLANGAAAQGNAAIGSSNAWANYGNQLVGLAGQYQGNRSASAQPSQNNSAGSIYNFGNNLDNFRYGYGG